MKKTLSKLLQLLIIVVALATLAFMLIEPRFEGRNAQATLFETYFTDPFLAYAYAASILYFVALYQAYKAIGYAAEGKGFSLDTLKALRTIRYCALALIVCILGAEAYMGLIQRGSDDIAGGVMMGLMMMIIATIAAYAALRFEQKVRRNLLNDGRLQA